MSKKKSKNASPAKAATVAKVDAKVPVVPGFTVPAVDVQTPAPDEITTPLPDDETTRDAPKTDPEPPSPVVTEKTIIPWLGTGAAHKCPDCGAVILHDRMTKACLVRKVRQPVFIDGQYTVMRDMECMMCHVKFLTRETKSQLSKRDKMKFGNPQNN